MISLYDLGNPNKISNFMPDFEEKKSYFEYESNSPKIIDGPEISYFLNKQGFRSQDFDNFDSKNFNILVAGDSFTFGDSLPNDCVWPQILKNKFVKKNIEIFNLGFNANSIREIVKNTIAFIRKYGSPDIVVLLLPPENRNILFDEENNTFTKGMRESNWLLKHSGNISKKSKIRFYRGYNQTESYLLAIDLMHMLEDILFEKNIPFVWATHQDKDEKIYEKIKFKNFVKIDYSNGIEVNESEAMPYWEIAKDNAHPGSKWHVFFAEFIFKKIESFIK